MNPNPFRFRLITLDEVGMPIGNGQIVGFERFWFDNDVRTVWVLPLSEYSLLPAFKSSALIHLPFE